MQNKPTRFYDFDSSDRKVLLREMLFRFGIPLGVIGFLGNLFAPFFITLFKGIHDMTVRWAIIGIGMLVIGILAFAIFFFMKGFRLFVMDVLTNKKYKIEGKVSFKSEPKLATGLLAASDGRTYSSHDTICIEGVEIKVPTKQCETFEQGMRATVYLAKHSRLFLSGHKFDGE